MLQHIDQGDRGRLVLIDELAHQEQGFLSYELSGSVADAQHTIVHEAYQGQGLAAELAQAFLALVESRGWRVRPSCSYIARYMERHPELISLREEA